MKTIYLDNAATTRPSNKVIERSQYIMKNLYANPSSMHKLGFDVEKEIKETSIYISNYLNVLPEEIYYTSGATESNNLSIIGSVKARIRKYNHLIVSKTEHPSVIEPFKILESLGCKIDYLDVDENGYIFIDKLEELISENTALVSIMHINNETGVVQDINNIGKIIKNKNKNTIFHVDGVQSYCKRNINLKYIDIFTFSSHKIHGIKGIGGLYINKNIKVLPQMFGGGQQNFLRPGTENTFGIILFKIATEERIFNMQKDNDHILNLRDRLLSIKEELKDVYINSDIYNCSPYILNISFLGIKSEVLIYSLEEDCIYVSSESACSSKDKNKNNILRTMGKDKDIYTSSIRFSFSYENSIEDIDLCIASLKKNIKKLRQLKIRK